MQEGTALVTDEMAAYKGLNIPYPIWSVNYSKGEYVRRLQGG